MKKVLRKGIIFAGITAMIIGMVGCVSKNSEDDVKEENTGSNQVEVENNEAEEEVTEDYGNLPIATIKVKDFGEITLVLYPEKAPNTVNNFIDLANSGYYDGLIFHRIIKGFMNQGGDPNGTGTGGPGYSIKGEFSSNGFEQNDLKHTAGVISMARSGQPDSAGSQFFIMADEAPHLDGEYAAFGEVIKGMKIVAEMNEVKTGNNDKPVEDVVIEEIRVDTKGVEYPAPEKM